MFNRRMYRYTFLLDSDKDKEFIISNGNIQTNVNNESTTFIFDNY